MARVFISHSSRDDTHAAEMKTWLGTQGFEQVFLDFDNHSGIGVGADWERTLYREIERCQALIIILTPNWLESKWCFAEFTQARALGKPIFPVIETPSGDTLIAPDIQHLDLTRDREGGLERLAASLTEIALDAQGHFKWDPGRPPYPGLLSFEEEDAAIYFGRDDDIRALIERLNARRVQGGKRLVTLLGASGSGKSSLLRAGVLPRLRRNAANWIVLPPFRPQSAPLDELARSAAIALGRGAGWRDVRDRLRETDFRTAVTDLVHDLRVANNTLSAHVLISIDQAEELFATVAVAERHAFFRFLSAILDGQLPLLVVAGLRSDYLGDLQTEQELTAPFEEFSLKPMPVERIRQVILGPARVAGLNVEEELVARATRDAETEDALPLLAFALRELHDRFGNDDQLTLAEYQALGDQAHGLTPLENAVRRAADDVIETAQPSEKELHALKEAFIPAMVRVNSEGEYVRRPADWNALPAEAHSLLERLARARLLVLRSENDTRILEVAHEALLRKWPRLNGWLNDEREFLIGKNLLEQDVHDWERALDTEKPSALLTGLKLNRAEAWLTEHPHRLSERERAFVGESLKAARGRQRRKQRTRQAVTLGSSVAAVIIAMAGWWAWGVMQERNAVAAEAARADIRGEIVAFATARGQTALDTMEGSKNSPYTTALVEVLRDPSLSVLGALTALNQRVIDNSRGYQRPFLSTSMNGDIYLWKQPASRRRLAIIVSADHAGRNLSPLVAPTHDAAAFAEVLEDAGFRSTEIVRLHNPDSGVLLSTLEEQLEKLSSAPGRTSRLPERTAMRLVSAGIKITPQDGPNEQNGTGRGLVRQQDASDNSLLIFYYAGHGVAISDGDYLILPSNSDIATATDVRTTAVGVTQLSGLIGRHVAASIMILDTNFTFAFDAGSER